MYLVDELIELNDPEGDEWKYPCNKNFYSMIDTKGSSIIQKLNKWEKMNNELVHFITDISHKLRSMNFEFWPEMERSQPIARIEIEKTEKNTNTKTEPPQKHDIEDNSINLMQFIKPVEGVDGLFWDHYHDVPVRSETFSEN